MLMSQKETGSWGRNMLPEEVNSGFRTSMAMINLLEVRVKDEKIRELATEFRNLATSGSLAKSPQESTIGINRAMLKSDALHERIGSVLRSLDDDEDRVIGA